MIDPLESLGFWIDRFDGIAPSRLLTVRTQHFAAEPERSSEQDQQSECERQFPEHFGRSVTGAWRQIFARRFRGLLSKEQFDLLSARLPSAPGGRRRVGRREAKATARSSRR